MKNNLANIRKSKHMTQKELAEISGISRATISAMENGVERNATSGTLVKLAEALGVTVSQMIE